MLSDISSGGEGYQVSGDNSEGGDGVISYTSTVILEPRNQRLNEITVEGLTHSQVKAALEAYAVECRKHPTAHAIFDPKDSLASLCNKFTTPSLLSAQQVHDLSISTLKVALSDRLR